MALMGITEEERLKRSTSKN